MRLPKAKKFVSFAVKQILTKHLAPDTICGLAGEKDCFIERGLLKARNIDLTLKVRRKQHRKGHPEHKRLYGLSIEARPQVVNQREEFGHWEFASLPQLLPTIPIYYAHPYSAYERGLNEKQNSLIRRFLPKGSS